MADIRAFMDLVTESTLNEMHWRERSSMAGVLASHAGSFVHFSNINKIGINPTKSHSDPHGVYLYPVDWITNTDHFRVKNGHQYGFDYPFYFIADIRWNTPGGVILSKMSWEHLYSIGERNGWKQYLDEMDENGNFRGQHRIAPYVKMDQPGSVFYHFGDMLQKAGVMNWSQYLKGVPYIYDDDGQIIHSNEPAQIIVMDPRAMKVVDSGSNPDSHKVRDVDVWAPWAKALSDVLKTLSEKFDGRLVWKNKRPILTFAVREYKFTLTINEKFGFSLNIAYTFRRAKGHRRIERKAMEEAETRDDLVRMIEYQIEQITDNDSDSDLNFKPLFEEDVVKHFVQYNLLNGENIKWDVEIDNDDAGSDIKHRSQYVFMTGTVERTVDDVKIWTQIYIPMTTSYFSVKINTKVNGVPFVNFEVPMAHFTSFEEAQTKLFERMDDEIDHQKWRYGPKKDDPHYRPRFSNDAEWNAFIGWFVENSGLNFDGQVAAKYSENITAYEDSNKEYLSSDIKHALRDWS